MSTAHRTFDYDVAILGGGSGGYAAARTAAGAGLKTVVVEGGEQMGGLCILRGCMPTKALLYAAEVLHLAGHPQTWGIHAKNVTFDFAQVMARKDALIKEFADYRQQQLARGKFKLFRAKARFVDAHTVELTHLPAPQTPPPATQPSSAPPEPHATSGAGEPPHAGLPRTLTARNFVLATGSMLAPSPLAFLNRLDCLTSDTALALRKLPKSIIVLGGGAVAVEFAQFFARFGVQVTLVQRSPHILHEFDGDAAAVLETVFRREGITVYTGTKLLDARRTKAHKEVSFEHQGHTVRVQAEEVLYALGRIPNIASLALDKAGVQVEYGRITTNYQMQTTVPHIYAAGDCTGLHEIVHIAIQQGEIAAHNLAHPNQSKQMDYRLLSEIIFTEPQIAVVGLTEKRAHVRNIPYEVASYPFNDHGKSLIMEAKDGFVKLLAEPTTGEIIGGACVGPVGGELIHEIIVAMAKHMTVHELAAVPHYHPTLAEIWTYPAEELAANISL